MSQAERYAWLSLIAWGLILFFLVMRFTTGAEILGQTLGLTIVEQSAARLLWTYVTLAVWAIIAESVIATVLAVMQGKDDIEKDERDRAIDARAKLASYWFMAAALNIIVIHGLANAAYGPVLIQLDVTSLTGVAFALLLVLTLAEIVNRAAVVALPQRSCLGRCL
jgi:hypothetical protein